MKMFIFLSKIVMTSSLLFLGKGSYNSFRNQTGFCKLQGFDTISRSTSIGPPLLALNIVQLGVGLNQFQFQHNISNCGRCLLIHQAKNFPLLNTEIDQWDYTQDANFPVLAFVMDECMDLVCENDYLDFDIYHLEQPVAYGNPYDIVWEFVDCPRMYNHQIEFLFCFSNSCKENDEEGRSIVDVLISASPYFWTINIRNTISPIYKIDVLPYNVSLSPRESWTWDFGTFSFFEPFSLVLNDKHTFEIDFLSLKKETTTPSYRGGFIVQRPHW